MTRSHLDFDAHLVDLVSWSPGSLLGPSPALSPFSFSSSRTLSPLYLLLAQFSLGHSRCLWLSSPSHLQQTSSTTPKALLYSLPASKEEIQVWNCKPDQKLMVLEVSDPTKESTTTNLLNSFVDKLAPK